MLTERIAGITPDNIVDAMLEIKTKWSASRRLVKYVMILEKMSQYHEAGFKYDVPRPESIDK